MDEEELRRNQDGIQSELALLQSFADLASGIKTNAKGDNLISALTQGFKKIEQLGGQRKAVILLSPGVHRNICLIFCPITDMREKLYS